MTTIKSSFNKKRFKNCYIDSLKRYRGLGGLYFTLSFIFFPVQYIIEVMTMINYERARFTGWAQCFTGVSSFFFTALTIGAAILIPTILLSYMHNKRSVDVYHSLPYTREELLLANTASGLTLIYIPIIINFLVIGITNIVYSVSQGDENGLLMQTLGLLTVEMIIWMIFVFSTFVITVFAAVQVGSIFDTMAFSVVLNGSIAGMYLLVWSVSSGVLYGFNNHYNVLLDAHLLSPIGAIYGRMDNLGVIIGQSNVAFLFWIVISVLLLILSLKLYKKRDSEQAEVLGTLGPLSSYVRAIGTLIGGSGLAIMFIAIAGIESIIVVLIITFFSCLLVYLVGDIILARRVRLPKKTIIAGSATSLVVTTLATVLLTGGLGFEERVPNAEDVVSVTLSNYMGRYNYEQAAYYFDSKQGSFTNESKITLENPESIASIVDFHTKQIESFKNDEDANVLTRSRYGGSDINDRIKLEYTLKNGRTMFRYYYGFYNESVAPMLELETNEEFLTSVHSIFRAKQEEIAYVNVYNNVGETDLISLTADEKEYLLNTLREELLNQPASEIAKSKSVGIVALTLIEEDFDKKFMHNISPEEGRVLIPTTGRSYGTSNYNTSHDREYITGSSTSEEHYYSEVVLTESFVKTLKFLEEHTDMEFEKDPSDHITEAYATFYGNNNVVINPYSWKAKTMEEPLYDYNNRVYENGKYKFLETPFIEIDLEDIDDLMKQSFDIFDGTEPRVMIAYQTDAEGKTTDRRVKLDGCTFVPLSALSQDVRDELLITSHAYNKYSLSKNNILLEENELKKVEEFIAKNIDEHENLPPDVDFSSY